MTSPQFQPKNPRLCPMIMKANHMNFIITYLAADGSLRTAKSEDIPAKIAKHLTASISLLETFEEEVLTKIITVPATGLTEEDAMKINMYDQLVEVGVNSWEGWDLALEQYNTLMAESDEEPVAEAA